MVANLRRGDTIVTTGGLIGKVAKVDETEIQVEARRRRPGAHRARHDRRGPRQGRAGEGERLTRARLRRSPDPVCMLQIARWKAALILLVVVAAIVVVIPNFFSAATVDNWPSWLPQQQVVLGLDLQGGAYLLYEVDRTDYVAEAAAHAGQRRPQGDAGGPAHRLHRPRRSGPGRAAARPRSRPARRCAQAARAAAQSAQHESARRRLGQRVRPDRRRRRPGPLRLFRRRPDAARFAASSSSRSRSSTAASTNSAPPSRPSSARATTASWSRRPASAIRSA